MVQTIQRSFTGGEIAPSLRSRADLVKYSTGLALCENMIVRSQGGAYSRPGTKFVAEIGQSDRRARLIPFSFNTEQTYILVFENLTMRVIRDGGYVLDGLNPYEISTPYTESELPRLSFTQDADVMTIVHPNHAPRDLGRTADDAWTLSVINFTPPVDPPEWAIDSTIDILNITQNNPAQVTTDGNHGLSNGDVVTIDGVVGMTEINGITDSAGFASGNTFFMQNTDSSAFTAYTSGGSVTKGSPTAFGDGAGDFDKTYTYILTTVDVNGVESVASEPRSLTTPSLSSTAGVRLLWDSVPSASYYRVYKDPSNGTGVFGWIGDSKTNQFDDYNIAPLTSDAPPTARDPFTEKVLTITDFDPGTLIVESASHGLINGETVLIEGILQPTNFNDQSFTVQIVNDDSFKLLASLVGPFPAYTSGGTATRSAEKPSVVSYYQQRRVFANTNENPQTVYTTQSGDYDSLRSSVPARDDDAVTFTIKGREVNAIRHIIDVDGMILLTSGAEWRVTEGQDRVLTPSTVGARIQSYFGASWITPQIVGDTVIFIQEKGSRVRDIKYEFVDDKYSGTDLSIMAEHLFEGYEIEEMSFAQEPYSIVWLVRNDGKLLGLTYQREHQVWAWHQHDLGGEVESVATISEGRRDATYLVIKRTINGSDVRYIERMEERVTSAAADVWAVDSGLQYSGVAATTISGLEHLEGEAVAVVSDGNEVKNLVVSSGAITLPRAATKVTVGLSYTPVVELLDVDLSSSAETLKGKDVSVSRVIIEFENSRGGWVGPKKDDGTVDEMREIKPRQEEEGYDTIPLRTFKDEIYIEPQWSLGGGIRIEQRAPFPLTILSVIPEIDVS